MAPARFLPFALLVLVAIVCAIVAENTPPVNHRFAHTRFVRRNFHQSAGDDKESSGAVPIRHKAPPPAFMYDEDLVRFVQCHYDPSITDCDETKDDDNEESVKTGTSRDHASQEHPSGELSDEEAKDQPAIDKFIQDDGDEDDDDYSYLIDESIVEYINKHLEPTTD